MDACPSFLTTTIIIVRKLALLRASTPILGHLIQPKKMRIMILMFWAGPQKMGIMILIFLWFLRTAIVLLERPIWGPQRWES